MSLAPRIDSLKASAANLIINGNMDFWQRGVSFSSPASGSYTADRWNFQASGLSVGTMTIAQLTDVPNNNAAYSLGVTVGTAYTVNPSTGVFTLSHTLEGNDARLLYNQTATLSFWAKCSVTGTYSVRILNPNGPNYAVLVTPFTVANTGWNQYTISLGTISTAIGSSWVTGNTAALRIDFVLACPGYQTSNTSWFATTSPPVANTSQTGSFLTTAGAVFELAQVQLNQGAYAQNFTLAGGTIAGELVMCQRYAELMTFNNFQQIGTGHIESSTSFYGAVSWKTTKRIAPPAIGNFTITGSQAANSGVNTYALTSPSLQAASDTCAILRYTATGGTNGIYEFRENANSVTTILVSVEL